MDHNTLLTAVEREGRALLAAAERDPSARIEHCPDWDASGLVDHIAGVWSFMAAQIEAASPDKPTGPDPDDPSTASDRLSRLVALLASVEPATPCWNWCPKEGRTASWMVRRMAHENNIHRWDAENAVGNPDPLDADLAHDGVDEILDVAWRHQLGGRGRRAERRTRARQGRCCGTWHGFGPEPAGMGSSSADAGGLRRRGRPRRLAGPRSLTPGNQSLSVPQMPTKDTISPG